MKKIVLLLCLVCGSVQAHSQIIILEVIKAVINAADLVIQQVQNETIVFQNAEKEITNVMSKLQLDDITDWVQKQKDLYDEYYGELAAVKDLISGYDKLKNLILMQKLIVSEYQSAYHLFAQDKHFTALELAYMTNVYSGIIDQSLKNLNQALLVVQAASTSMTDAARMGLIDAASDGMQRNYDDIRKFNSQNRTLSIQRATEQGDLESVRSLYNQE